MSSDEEKINRDESIIVLPAAIPFGFHTKKSRRPPIDPEIVLRYDKLTTLNQDVSTMSLKGVKKNIIDYTYDVGSSPMRASRLAGLITHYLTDGALKGNKFFHRASHIDTPEKRELVRTISHPTLICGTFKFPLEVFITDDQILVDNVCMYRDYLVENKTHSGCYCVIC